MIASIAKIYIKEQKYNSLKSLDYKFFIFYGICYWYSLDKKDLVNTFPTILKSIAYD
jgi:hypothetical protein